MSVFDSSNNSVEILVLSHLKELLEPYAGITGLTTIFLPDLEIPEKIRGSHLGEMRVFYSKIPNHLYTPVVGMVSARWNERCLDYPPLDRLPEFAQGLEANQYAAPHHESIKSPARLRHWIYLQDLSHPGMAKLLNAICESEGIDTRRNLGDSALGGQYLMRREDFLQLQEFMVRNLGPIIDKYGVLPPISYRCPVCGISSQNGLDRWTDERRLGYLAERIASIYFISRPDLRNVLLTKVGKSLFTREIGPRLPLWTQKLATHLTLTMMRLRKACGH